MIARCEYKYRLFKVSYLCTSKAYKQCFPIVENIQRTSCDITLFFVYGGMGASLFASPSYNQAIIGPEN